MISVTTIRWPEGSAIVSPVVSGRSSSAYSYEALPSAPSKKMAKRYAGCTREP
jgi:hypothetical protein